MSAEGGRPGPRYRKLQPRPGSSGKEVAEHQRGRIHAATIELVDEGGYEDLTVTGIARAAGVSNRTFYENFSGKDDCFLATYDLIVRHTAREVLGAMHGERNRRAKLRAGFLAFAREVAEKPSAARLVLIEAFAAHAAFERMRHTNGLFEALVAESFTVDGQAGPPALVVKGIVAGVTRVARARVLAGEERRLPDEVDALMQWALAIVCPEAREVCPGSVRAATDAPTRAAPNEREPLAVVTDQLLGDERTMILAAAARLAANDGYDELSVPRIRAAAGVSRRRFEQHFEGVTDCLLAALELLAGRVFAKAKRAYCRAGAWPHGIHRVVTTICREIADDPVLVRLAFFELYAPGRRTVRWRADLIAVLGCFLNASAPSEKPAGLAGEASVGAAWAALHHYATTGRAEQLPRVAGTVSYLLLAPAVGAGEAAEVIRAEEQRTVLTP